MTLPNGIDGISEAIGTLFASGGPLTPVPNAATWGANPISQMNTLTQGTVTQKIKQNQILNSTGWNNTTAALYEGLRRGNPSDGNVPLITSSLEAMVNKLFGTDIQWPTNAEVIAAIERVPLMTELVGALQSIYKGLTGQESVTDVLNDLNTDIQTALSEIQNNTGQFLDDVLVDLGLPTSEASAFAAWLSGSAAGQRITNVSSAVVVNGNQQLLESPNFAGAISIAGNGIWTWNSTIYYIIPGETVDEPGSAQITANGTTQILTSTPAEDIPLGQPVDYSIRVCTNGLTGGGTLLQLVAIPWIGTTAQTPVVLASSAAPTGATTGWTNPPSGSKATVLSGVYTPTTSSGVTAVSMQLVLTNAALSGTVYWSAASEELTGGLINDLMNENAAGQQASATYWTSLGTAVNQILGGNWSGGFATAENAWQTYQVAQAGVASAQYVTLHQLLSMVGINTGSGMMAASNVTSALGGASLGSDVVANKGTIDTHTTNFNNTWSWLFGTTSPTSTTPVQATKVASALGGASIAGDVTANKSAIDTHTTNFNNTWSWLYGTTAPTSASQVQPAVVPGTQGISTITQTVQNTWDSIATQVAHYLGLDAVLGTNNPLSTVQDVLGQHASQTAAALSQANTNAGVIEKISPSIGQPLITGPLPNQVAAIAPLSAVTSTMATMTGASGSAPIAFITFVQATKIDSFTLIANLSASTGTQPTAFYVNFYTVNLTTGLLTQIATTGNILGSVPAFTGSTATVSGAWLTVALASEISLAAGAVLAVELVTVGTSSPGVSYAVVNQFAPPLPSGYPTTLGAARNAGANPQPATIPQSSVITKTVAPWVGFNGPGQVYNYPIMRKITSSQTAIAPPWARFADVVVLGGGGSGAGGIGFPGNPGGSTTVTQGTNSITASGGNGGNNGTSFVAGDAIGQGAPTEVYTPPGMTTADSFPGSTDVVQQRAGSLYGGGGGGGTNNAGAYGYGGQPGQWNAATWTISGGETFTVSVGAGGAVPSGQSVGAAAGSAGVAYIVFRAS